MLSDERIEAAICDLLDRLAGIENELKKIDLTLRVMTNDVAAGLNDIEEDLLNLKVKIDG